MRNPREIAADVSVALAGHHRASYRSTQREGAVLAVDIGPHTPRTIVEVHHALIRSIPRKEIALVYFFDSELGFPRWVDDHAIRLSSVELDAGRRRVEAFVPAPEPRFVIRPTIEGDDFGCVLVVEPNFETAEHLRTEAPDLWIAAGDRVTTHALERGFDIVICAIDWSGRIPDVLPGRFAPPPQMIWTVGREHDALALAQRMNQIVVRRPVPIALVRSLLPDRFRTPRPRTPTPVKPFSIPKPPARRTRPQRVLVLEQDPAQRAFARRTIQDFAMVDTPEDEWQLLDCLRDEPQWDLVLCDVSWQIPGFEPVHRMVRRIRPNLANRIRLLVSTTDSGDARVMRRPIDGAEVRKILDQLAT